MAALAEPAAGPPQPAGRVWLRDRELRLALVIGVLVALAYAVSEALPQAGAWPYLPPALLGLWFFGRKAIAGARAGSPFSIEMLVTIATVGAILIGATPEAAMMVFLFIIGQMLEGVAAGRARAGIEALTVLLPRTAPRIEEGVARQVPAASLAVGDIVLVRPGDRVSAVLPQVNAEAMSLHLDEISTQVAPGAHAVVVLDGAGWHQQGGRLKIPGTLTLLSLPPYAPELNSAESLWAYLRSNRLSHKL